MKLKADFHIHTKEDKIDKVSYNAEELIDYAKKSGFDVLAITNHNIITYSEDLKNYALEKDIVLIPGVEVKANGKHIIILNETSLSIDIKRPEDIYNIKRENNLIVAPHPYFPAPHSLNRQFEKYIDLFDAVEYTSFYINIMPFNRKAKKMAEMHNLPLIGNSDAHYIEQLGKTYTIVDAEKNADSIIKSIKEKKVELITKPLGFNMKDIKIAASFFRMYINLFIR